MVKGGWLSTCDSQNHYIWYAVILIGRDLCIYVYDVNYLPASRVIASIMHIVSYDVYLVVMFMGDDGIVVIIRSNVKTDHAATQIYVCLKLRVRVVDEMSPHPSLCRASRNPRRQKKWVEKLSVPLYVAGC
jgi:hypothetical protein